MASRECGTVGVLMLMLFCIGSAHRLFPSEAPTNHIQPGPDSKYKSTGGFSQKPAGEPMDVDGHVSELFEISAREVLGRIPLAQVPTNGPWDSDCPAEKEKQDGEPCMAASLTKYGAASPKAVRAQLTKPLVIDSTYSPSHGISAPPPDEVHVIQEATPPVEVHAFQEATPPVEVHAIQEGTPPDEVHEVHAIQEGTPPDEVHAIQQEDFFGDFANPDPEFI